MSQTFIKAFPRETATKDAPVGVRLMSGRQVMDEGLIDRRFICRYRLCSGQVLPDMHLSEAKYTQLSEKMTNQSFSISVNGEKLEKWDYEGFSEIPDTSWFKSDAKVFAVFLLNNKKHVRVKVITRLDGSDIVIRWLEIENLSDKTIGLDYVYPLSGRIWDHFTGLWYDMQEALPENALPYEIAYCHETGWGKEGDFYFNPIKKNECISFGSVRGKSGWNRPSFWLRNKMNGETFVCELGYSGNWTATAAYTVTPFGDRNEWQNNLCAQIGITAPDGEVVRTIKPGEKLETPAVHFGVFRETDDYVVQALHSHVRHVVLPKLPDGVPITELEANHRGYLCDRENHDGIINDIDAAAHAGVELYVFDAGWYGNEPNIWPNNTGDWFAGPWLKHGLEPISAYVHEKGMRFGLWAEIEAIGCNSNLVKEHPEWRMLRYGEPCVRGRALDLANPVVEEWITCEIGRMIEQYNLDMFRIDHNHDIEFGGTREVDGFIENTLWRYYDALYRIFHKVAEKYPMVVFQNCAGGGGRMDLGILRCFHNSETSDWMRMPRGMRSFRERLCFCLLRYCYAPMEPNRVKCRWSRILTHNSGLQ